MARRLKSASYLRERRRQRAVINRLAIEYRSGKVPDDFREICRAERVDSTEVMREIYQRQWWTNHRPTDPTAAPEGDCTD